MCVVIHGKYKYVALSIWNGTERVALSVAGQRKSSSSSWRGVLFGGWGAADVRVGGVGGGNRTPPQGC